MVDYLNLLAAALHVLVGAFVAYEILRLGRRAPRTAGALVAFFLLGGAALLNDPDPLLGYDLLLAGVLDVAVAGVLVILAFDARKLVRAAVRTVDEDDFRRREYERARRDYGRLVRHRVFNPLATVRGAAETLKARWWDDETRDMLLDSIIDAARRLERVTADPVVRSPEERGLDPAPRLEAPARRGVPTK